MNLRIAKSDMLPRDGQATSRRGWFQQMSTGLLGAAALHLCSRDAAGVELEPVGTGAEGTHADAREADNLVSPHADTRPRLPHRQPPARSVIHLFMNGGPSQMDLFDPKPYLDAHHGESFFDKIAGEVESPGSAGAIFRCPYKFAQHGESGMWMSDVMPNLSKRVDDIALIRSMYTTNLTHEPAVYLMQSGRMTPGRPTLGAWVTYGLGSENQDLPAYVVLDDPLGLPVNGVENWQAGFLPAMFQGTRLRSEGKPLLNLDPDTRRSPAVVRGARSLRAELDRLHLEQRPGQDQLAARIASYELAARMQMAASDALDLAQESPATHRLYGIGQAPTDSYGRRCLMARRLVERGVRFVQLYINAQIWDNHSEIETGHRDACARTDLPIAGLLQDLKQRGLLESTLVVWGGEFGRLPIAQLPGDKNIQRAGRDHNKNAFSCWLAGAGVRGGTTYGATDDLGMAAIEDRVSVPDWHATILHLLGLDHERLFIHQNGLREKLTGVAEAHPVRGILA